jgi:multicomponent Na+:H+ antiporter subunit F
MISTGLTIALVLLVVMLLACGYRALASAGNWTERLQAIDAMTTLLLGIMIVLAALQGMGMLLDVAIALAAFAFIATLGISRYLAEGRVF